MTQKQKINLLFEIDSAIKEYITDVDMDFCGAWCNVDVLNSMLRTPTYSNSIKHLISLVESRISTVGINGIVKQGNIENLLQKASENGIYIEAYEILVDEQL